MRHYRVRWEKESPKAIIQEVVSRGRKPVSMPLEEAINKYVRSFGDTSKRYAYAWELGRLAKNVGPKKDISTITVGEIKKLISAKKISFRTGGILASCLFWHTSPNGDASLETKSLLKWQPAPLELLPHLARGAASGRFQEIKTEIQRQIQVCPPNEFRTLKPNADLIKDPKERKSLLNNVGQFLIKNDFNWRFRWSPVEEVFYLAPLAELAKLKMAKKKEKK